MTARPGLFRFLRANPARRLAQLGAALFAITLFACGTSTGATDNDGGDGSQTGGAASGGAASGGAASGGAASGGTASGGSAGSGGDGSGGDGSGGDAGMACPGVTVPAFPTCRTQTDCTGGAACRWDPVPAGTCGACFPAYDTCPVDGCEDGFVCIEEPADACQCMGGDRVCAPACTETSCGEGQVCGSDGHCATASCVEDGYACPEDRICDPERAGADVHGCAYRSCVDEGYVCPETRVCEVGDFDDAHGCRSKTCDEGLECGDNTRCNTEGPGCVTLTCQADADCDCGYCINGGCAGRLNICVILPS